MGEKKLEDEKDLVTIKYQLDSIAYEMCYLASRNRTIALYLTAAQLQFIDAPEELKDKAQEEASGFFQPERPEQLDDKYKGWNKKWVKELKGLRWEQIVFKLERPSTLDRIFLWLAWHCHEAPLELKKIVAKDYIFDRPKLVEEDTED